MDEVTGGVDQKTIPGLVAINKETENIWCNNYYNRTQYKHNNGNIR